jgi:hypothetical protein
MKKLIALGAVAVMTAAVPVVAHHAFGGEFDPNRPLLLKGKIVKLEWVNPHTWIHIEIPAGSVKGLRRETVKPCQFTPNANATSGWSKGARRTRCFAAASPRNRC